MVAAQSPGFREDRRGAFGIAFERIGGGEMGMRLWYSWAEAAPLFEPDDSLVGARLQQIRLSNRVIAVAVEGIAD
jgi:hypothetical protein